MYRGTSRRKPVEESDLRGKGREIAPFANLMSAAKDFPPNGLQR